MLQQVRKSWSVLFVWVGYTQPSLRMLALCQEISDVKLRRVVFASLPILFMLCASVRVFAMPDAPKQFDPKLFKALRWRLIGPPRAGRVLAGSCCGVLPGIVLFWSAG